MELRHFKEALNCLNECVDLAEDKVADVYFRRSQVRTYNKGSSDLELKLALDDIEKAIALKSEIKIYQEHKEILIKIINRRATKEKEKIQSIITNKM